MKKKKNEKGTNEMFTTKLIDNSFGNDGITAFCEGLKMNQSVTTLYLRSE